MHLNNHAKTVKFSRCQGTCPLQERPLKTFLTLLYNVLVSTNNLDLLLIQPNLQAE